MPTIEFNDDTKALEYIRDRGYASYSSMKNVRDCQDPQPYDPNNIHLRFGKELHSRYLEGKTIEVFKGKEKAYEQLAKDMINALRKDVVASALVKGASVEEKFDRKLKGVQVLGYIDINKPKLVADLKTTRLTNKKAFAASMDFLQAALYLRVTKKKDFFYVGISKEKPHRVMVFNVMEFPGRLEAANKELDRLLKYLKNKL